MSNDQLKIKGNDEDWFKSLAVVHYLETQNSYSESIVIDNKIKFIMDVRVDNEFNSNNCSKQMYIISKLKDIFLNAYTYINGESDTRGKNLVLEQHKDWEDIFIFKGKEADVKECKAFIINGLTQCYKNRKKIKYQKEIKDEIDVIIKFIII